MLVHPYTPEHHIMLTGERYGVTLPWPRQVHQVTGTLLLPPTVTPRGPITWIHPPRVDSLRLCREIDLFGALRTVLNDLITTDRGETVGKDQDDKDNNKSNDSGSKHGQEDNTGDASRDRPVPDRADPNKHDR